MKLLRLATTLNSTSAPYNQFSLGFRNSIDQTYCSFLPNELSIKHGIKAHNGNGSILKMIKLIKNLISHNDYDVVHIHSGITGIIFLISIFPFRVQMLNRTLFTLHNSWSTLKLRNQILNFIVMLVSKKICTCGVACKKSIPKIINLFIEKKTTSVVNGFDHNRIDIIKNNKRDIRFFSENSKIKILYVGALNNTKNQISLLKVLKHIKLKAEIIFLGDGKNKNKLIDFSKNFVDCTKIIFKGRVSRNIAIEHMLEADVSISLSKGEGLPIAVLESMYAGCFQILSKIPPHKEISPPSNRCIFVDQSNKLQIRNSLNFMINNISLIRAEKSVSQEYSINNFGIDNMLKRYKKVYDSFSNINS